jgi:hypothetical protein
MEGILDLATNGEWVLVLNENHEEHKKRKGLAAGTPYHLSVLL